MVNHFFFLLYTQILDNFGKNLIICRRILSNFISTQNVYNASHVFHILLFKYNNFLILDRDNILSTMSISMT